MRSFPLTKRALSLDFGLCRELINLQHAAFSEISALGFPAVGRRARGCPRFKIQNFLAEILAEKVMSAGVGAGVASGLIYISAGEKSGVSRFPVSARLCPKTPGLVSSLSGLEQDREGGKALRAAKPLFLVGGFAAVLSWG